MKEDILKAIEDNLPSATAAVLQDYLSTARDNERIVGEQKEKIETQIDIIANLRDDNLKLIERSTKAEDVAKAWELREKEITNREKLLAIDLLNKDVESSNKITNAVYNLVERIFGNNIVKQTVAKNIAVRNSDQQVYSNSGTVGVGQGDHIQTVEDKVVIEG